jgi:hypothetical protein
VTDGHGSSWAMPMTKEEIGWPDAILWLALCVTSNNCHANLAAGSTQQKDGAMENHLFVRL